MRYELQRRLRSALVCSSVLSTMAVASVACAQSEDLGARVARLEALVAAQQHRIDEQDKLLGSSRTASSTAAIIADPAWRVGGDVHLAEQTARGYAPGDLASTETLPVQSGPQAPIVSPPALARGRAELAAIPEGMSVLSAPGHLSFDFSADYTRSSANRLVFRGIEIVPGIQIGVIEANEADRDTITGNIAGRIGLTDRLEVEVRAPYVHRNDTITTVQQRDEAVTRTIDLKGDGIGDIEGAVRYQINKGLHGEPIFIGALRVKSDTGEGPFNIDRDEFGVATALATGSGFWGIEPSVSMLFASDPAVIFANLSYFAHLPRDIDQTSGEVMIGRVDPGDSIGAAIGFGFAMNQHFSYSLGYRHNYIFPTESELNGSREKSDDLQVGSLLFGMSYRFNDRFSLNGNFDFGVTEDAPDMHFVLRVPIAF